MDVLGPSHWILHATSLTDGDELLESVCSVLLAAQCRNQTNVAKKNFSNNVSIGHKFGSQLLNVSMWSIVSKSIPCVINLRNLK